jgi:hypothetical protein
MSGTSHRLNRNHLWVGILITRIVLAGMIGLAAGCQRAEVNRVDQTGGAHFNSDRQPPAETPQLSRNTESPEPPVFEPAPEPPGQEEDAPLPGEEISPLPQEPDLGHDALGGAQMAPPAEAPKTLVLDLKSSAMHVKLPEVSNGNKAQVQVKGVENLGTAYSLEPEHGVVTLEQPVDVVLTQYSGVRIRLALCMRGQGIVLQVASEIDLGQNKTASFTKERLARACADSKRDSTRLKRQWLATKSQAANIEKGLSTPGGRPAPVYNQMVQQLLALNNQTIPSLEQQMSFVQDRADLLQRLSELAEQIDGAAEIHYVLNSGAEDRAP